MEECDHCHGTGGEPGSRVDTCPNCHGSGQEAVIQNTPFGRMQSVRTCSRCHGTGKSIENLVLKCRGTGEMLAKTQDFHQDSSWRRQRFSLTCS